MASQEEKNKSELHISSLTEEEEEINNKVNYSHNLEKGQSNSDLEDLFNNVTRFDPHQIKPESKASNLESRDKSYYEDEGIKEVHD